MGPLVRSPDQKIYSYPAGDYIGTLSERTRDQTARQFAETKKRNQFILFVKDTQNKRLRSYILDLPGYSKEPPCDGSEKAD